MKIEALILSQFHEKKGLTMIEAVPKNCAISETQFSIASSLILPQEQRFCGKLLAIEFMDKYYLLGVPSLSENTPEKAPYTRSKYIYSINILVKKEAYLDKSKRPMFKQIAKKLGYFFKFVEETSNTIYKNETSRSYLQMIMEKAYQDLNKRNECVLSHFASCYTIINLNTPLYQPIIREIKKSSVPVTYLTQAQIDDIQSEFGRKLLNYARVGDFNIKRICEEMMNDSQVIKYYEKCMKMGLVFMVDMFCLQNRYCLTPLIHNFTLQGHKYDRLKQICDHISDREQKDSIPKELEKRLGLSFGKIEPKQLLKLYFQLSRKINLRKLIDSNLGLCAKINVVKWIRISQMLGLVKRVEQRLAFTGEEGQQFEFIPLENVKRELRLRKIYGYTENQREQCEKLNSLFSNHLKNMDSIDETCVGMEVDKSTLLRLISFDEQDSLKIFYTSQ